MYKAIKYFEDLQDDNHPYKVGDIFPRAGLEPKPIEARFQELASDQNRKGEALIALDEPVQEPKKKTGKK
ncbi:MAG: hypothetical protein GX786_10805 [Clostridiales bacterium]|nr:hypothetical protein [Clostridiales bacterium]